MLYSVQDISEHHLSGTPRDVQDMSHYSISFELPKESCSISWCQIVVETAVNAQREYQNFQTFSFASVPASPSSFPSSSIMQWLACVATNFEEFSTNCTLSRPSPKAAKSPHETDTIPSHHDGFFPLGRIKLTKTWRLLVNILSTEKVSAEKLILQTSWGESLPVWLLFIAFAYNSSTFSLNKFPSLSWNKSCTLSSSHCRMQSWKAYIGSLPNSPFQQRGFSRFVAKGEVWQFHHCSLLHACERCGAIPASNC